MCIFKVHYYTEAKNVCKSTKSMFEHHRAVEHLPPVSSRSSPRPRKKARVLVNVVPCTYSRGHRHRPAVKQNQGLRRFTLNVCTPRSVSTPRDVRNRAITTVRVFVATAHGLPCQGCGPGRS